MINFSKYLIVTAAKFSRDGAYFVTGSEDKHIMVFKWALDGTCRPNQKLEAPQTPIAEKENIQAACEGGSTFIDSRKSIHYNYSREQSVC